LIKASQKERHLKHTRVNLLEDINIVRKHWSSLEQRIHDLGMRLDKIYETMEEDFYRGQKDECYSHEDQTGQARVNDKHIHQHKLKVVFI
jgi:hypothetical protein